MSRKLDRPQSLTKDLSSRIRFWGARDSEKACFLLNSNNIKYKNMEINEIICLILTVVVLCFLLWFQHNEGKRELIRFYNNIEIGDKYLNIPNRKKSI